MILGVKHSEVKLIDHNPEWETNAKYTIKQLWNIFGTTVKDIQHIGSTAIHHIKAKPVIDIAVLTQDFEKVLTLSPVLEEKGFFFIGWEGKENKQPVFQCGEYVQGENNMRVLTHYIHIVMQGNRQWNNYINFRDYMNAFPDVAIEYEALKLKLADENKNGGNLHTYHDGKRDYVERLIDVANNWNDSGRNIL
jgi:GrpB-like predicted nucleotidyltransferase (UPF0157 family)